MAYMRGEDYIWSDGEQLHVWSESGMDHWPSIYEGKRGASGVQIPEPLADEFAVMRFAELVRIGQASEAMDRALAKWQGNDGCAALEEFAERLKRAVRELAI
jgi:hypothetical protein